MPADYLVKRGVNAASRGLIKLNGNSVAVSKCFLRLREEFAHILLDQTFSKLILSADYGLGGNSG